MIFAFYIIVIVLYVSSLTLKIILSRFILDSLAVIAVFRVTFGLRDTSSHSAPSKPRPFCSSTLKLYTENKFYSYRAIYYRAILKRF